jgi:hypothetical protein
MAANLLDFELSEWRHGLFIANRKPGAYNKRSIKKLLFRKHAVICRPVPEKGPVKTACRKYKPNQNQADV